MKAKKVMKLALTGAFLLLTATTVLASKEVEVESITCPSTIVIGNITGSVTLAFEEYIKGVVYGELWPLIKSEDALKAQAVAARSYAVYLKDVLKRLQEMDMIYVTRLTVKYGNLNQLEGIHPR
jgi:hypothetical protein